ncbi:MAG: hypothetical protein EAZ34_06830 [Polaromonas sp.]|nr:MAG: hypothetical protein EAZ34_06830 [Polaromonas sp.]
MMCSQTQARGNRLRDDSLPLQQRIDGRNSSEITPPSQALAQKDTPPCGVRAAEHALAAEMLFFP